MRCFLFCIKFQHRADFIAALSLHDAVLVRHYAGGTKRVEHGLQRQHRGIVFLRQMAQGKLFAALLDEFQQLGRAFIVGKVPSGAFDAGA